MRKDINAKALLSFLDSFNFSGYTSEKARLYEEIEHEGQDKDFDTLKYIFSLPSMGLPLFHFTGFLFQYRVEKKPKLDKGEISVFNKKIKNYITQIIKSDLENNIEKFRQALKFLGKEGVIDKSNRFYEILSSCEAIETPEAIEIIALKDEKEPTEKKRKHCTTAKKDKKQKKLPIGSTEEDHPTFSTALPLPYSQITLSTSAELPDLTAREKSHQL